MRKPQFPDYSTLPDEMLAKTLVLLQSRVEQISKELAERFVPPTPAKPSFGWALVQHGHISLQSLRVNQPRTVPLVGRVAFVKIEEKRNG